MARKILRSWEVFTQEELEIIKEVSQHFGLASREDLFRKTQEQGWTPFNTFVYILHAKGRTYTAPGKLTGYGNMEMAKRVRLIVNLSLHDKAIADIVSRYRSESMLAPWMDSLINIVCGICQMPRMVVVGSARNQSIVTCRNIIWAIAHKRGVSYKECGEAIGGRHHSSVLHGIRTLAADIRQDKTKKSLYEKCEQTISISLQNYAPNLVPVDIGLELKHLGFNGNVICYYLCERSSAPYVVGSAAANFNLDSGYISAPPISVALEYLADVHHTEVSFVRASDSKWDMSLAIHGDVKAQKVGYWDTRQKAQEHALRWAISYIKTHSQNASISHIRSSHSEVDRCVYSNQAS